MKNIPIMGALLFALVLAACANGGTAVPANVTGIAANVAADALLAEALAGPALQLAFPGQKPGWVKQAACVSTTVASAASAVATAPAGSSVESEAVAALVSALNSYAASKAAGTCK